MKKRIICVLLFCSAFFFFPLYTDQAKIPENAKITTPVDFRASSLTSFFDKKKCPRPYYVVEYLQVADKYGLDYRLLPALSIRESTCGKHQLYNNWFGIGSAKALEHYKTPVQGIERAAQIITKHGIKHYGPANNPKYPAEIKGIMDSLHP